jgi:hypothetical protein
MKLPRGKKIHWEESKLNQAYKTHYELWTYGGSKPIMYVAKSHIDTPNNKEVVIWYSNGNMNGSCRQTIVEAIRMGIESAVYYFK